MIMILLWLLCVGLALGGLLAGFMPQVSRSILRFQWMRIAPVLAPAPRVMVRLLASGLRGRSLSPPYHAARAGRPDSIAGLG
jgi:hypothetical protein